ncbi:hypothetical protein FDK12_05755 [Arthrobacter sp. NamB2]|uniref:DUF6968 family protein n=1 Tax=Arthrobacter sp. NamB2 TaxID=2576035 RepID=UPI0010C9B33B|nr:hypothetical protein [Arthrobacter sp. NamB2]TKV29150.1 hypothetical protein FDK12_05755 [Arthrobacter sp. NamB2]
MSSTYEFAATAIIGSRTLHTPSGREVTIDLCAPERMPDAPNDWFCAYRIAGLEDNMIEGRALGIDALQALSLALVQVGDKLEADSTRLTFLEQDDLMLPTISTLDRQPLERLARNSSAIE